MKVCSKCKQALDLNMYFFQDKQASRLHSECKQCYKLHRKTYAAQHYQKYGHIYRDRAKTRRARIKKELQSKLLTYLEGKFCSICGESDIRVLDFDHLQPSLKNFGIARAITSGLNWDDIIIEINKCRILCANCHRKHTAQQQNWYKNISVDT